MPIDTILAAGSPFLNMGLQAINNIGNRRFSREMYNLQRQHAIEDRDYMNKYNSPEQQMKRLKEAGLNPNLVYGQGGAAVRSAETRGASPGPGGQTVAPQFDAAMIPQILLAFQNITNKQAEVDKLRAQIELIREQERLTGENTRKARETTELAALKLARESSLFDTDISFRKGQLETQRLKNEQTFTQTEQLRLESKSRVDKLLEEVLMLQAKRAVIPAQVRLIEQQIRTLESSEFLNESRKLSEDKQRSMMDALHESRLMDVLLKRGTLDKTEAETELRKIEAKWRAMGMSSTAVQDGLGQLIDIFNLKKIIGRDQDRREVRERMKNDGW